MGKFQKNNKNHFVWLERTLLSILLLKFILSSFCLVEIFSPRFLDLLDATSFSLGGGSIRPWRAWYSNGNIF